MYMKLTHYALLGLSLGLITPSVLGMSASEKSKLKKEIEAGLTTFATLEQVKKDDLSAKITKATGAGVFSGTEIAAWKKIFDEKGVISTELDTFATLDAGKKSGLALKIDTLARETKASVEDLRTLCHKKSIEQRLTVAEGAGNKIHPTDKTALEADIKKLPNGGKQGFSTRLAPLEEGDTPFTEDVAWNGCG